MPDGIVIQSPVNVIGTIDSASDSPGRSEDSQLAEACTRGDSLVFEQIYRRHSDRMKSVAFNQLGSRAEAEEAVQETFLKIHRGARTYKGDAAFSSWIYRILLNTCHDIVRRRSRRPKETPLENTPRETAAPAQSDEALRLTLRRLIRELPAQRRSVFLLYEVEGLSHREIAGILDIRESYSKWLLHAAKTDLRAMLRESEVRA